MTIQYNLLKEYFALNGPPFYYFIQDIIRDIKKFVLTHKFASPGYLHIREVAKKKNQTGHSIKVCKIFLHIFTPTLNYSDLIKQKGPNIDLQRC